MNFTPDEWDHPLATGGSDWNGRFYVGMAQSLERACFDYMRPVATCPLISAATARLGVVATLSTLAYPPFMLARLCSTLDHISDGRFG